MQYFEKYRGAHRKSSDVWSIDGTSFRVRYGIVHRVITMDPEKELQLSFPENKKFFAARESISGGPGGSGEVEIPPMFVFCVVPILESLAQEKNLSVYILLAASPIGYSNDILALKWLQHIDRRS